MNKRRWAWPAIVTIAGVFGFQNGAWSYITEPIILRVSHGIFNVLTLGIKGYKDGIYADAARGPHETDATSVLVMMFISWMTLFEVVVAVFHMLRRRIRIRYGPEFKDNPSWLDKLILGPKNSFRQTNRRISLAFYASMTILVVLASFLATNSLPGTYSTNAFCLLQSTSGNGRSIYYNRNAFAL